MEIKLNNVTAKAVRREYIPSCLFYYKKVRNEHETI